MTQKNDKDWIAVLQERLQDAQLPLEDGWGASAAASGPAPRAWWPWALAGVAAVLAAVLFLRPPQPSRPAPERVLLAQQTSLLSESIPPARPLRAASPAVRGAGAPASRPEVPDAAREEEDPGWMQEGVTEEGIPDQSEREERTDPPREDTSSSFDGEPGDPRPLEELTREDFPEEPTSGPRQRRPVSLRFQMGTDRSSPVAFESSSYTNSAGSFMYADYYNGETISWLSSGQIGPDGFHLVSSPGVPAVSWDPGQAIQSEPILQMGNSAKNAPQNTRYTERNTPVLPVSFGVSVALPMTRRLTLGTGLVYTQRPGDLTITEAEHGVFPTAVSRYHAALHYLGIPVDLHFYINPESRLRFYVGGGLQADKCIHVSGAEMLSEPVLFSANLQAGVDFSLLSGIRLYLSPALVQYLNHSAYLTFWDNYPLFSLRAGLSFDLK